MNGKKIFLILAFLLILVPAQAKWVKGRVNGPETPLAGVIVSDGYRFATTDKNGRFCLNTHKDARFVFVVTPTGYTADFSQGNVRFYLPLQGTKDFTFNLLKTRDGDDYTLFSVSDPQIQNDEHLACFLGRPAEDLQEMAGKYSAQRLTVGIALGDVAWNIHKYYVPYKEAIAKTGIPFYAVIGNHDFIQDKDGLIAGRAYEEAFGPYNYAFFLGRDLVIGVNNLLFVASGKKSPKKSSAKYSEGYSRETLDFVKGLLRHIGKDTHLYIAQHSPIRHHDKLIKGAEELLGMLEGYETVFLSGHTHYMTRQRINEHIFEYNAAAIGGAWWATDWCWDGTPRGYDVISDIAGERSCRWHNIDYPDDYQVEFISLGQARNHPNSVLANVWAVEEGWTCTWTEDGKEMKEAERGVDYSPSYTDEIMAWFDKNGLPRDTRFRSPRPSDHYFVATPSSNASRVTMTVSAPDGRSWTHEFDLSSGRPVELPRN